MQSELQTVGQEFGKAMQAKQWDAANMALDKIEKLLPEESRFQVLGARFAILIGKKDYPAASKLALQASDNNKDNAMLQNQFAWQIATDPEIEQRDLEVAETLARRADTASGGKDASVMRGKKKEAIELATKALALADDGAKAAFTKTLESYRQDKLPDAK
jgi:hypothetical protein